MIYLKSELVMVTADVARLLRDTCHFSRQRGLSDVHVERLADEMDRGSFIAGTQITFGVYPDKSMVILNGNHTLEAVAASGVPIALTFTYVPVKDDDDAGRIYAQFDIHRVRNWGDAYKAYGFNEELPAYWATPVGTALGIILGRFDSAINARDPLLKSRDIRSLIMRKYVKQSIDVMNMSEGASTANVKLFRRGGVLAVALETLRYQPSAASEFWRGMLLDDGLKNGDPRRTLLAFLRGRQTSTKQDRDLQSRGCALAWNAAFKGKTLTVLRPAYMIDIRIEGTPWVRDNYNPLAELTPVKKFMPAIASIPVDRPSFSSGMKVGVDGNSPLVLFSA